MNLPQHKCSLSIEHNDQRICHRTVAQELELLSDTGCPPDWKDEESKQRAVASNDMWTMRWYPNTPVGFHYVAAPTLEELLEWAIEYERKRQCVSA